MPGQGTPLDGSQAIGSTCTDNPVTACGGLARVVAFAERIGLAAKLAEALVRTSPHATPPHHVVLVVLQADVPVRQRVGLRRFLRPATVTRVFRRFTPKAIPATVEPRWTWGLDRLPQPAGETPSTPASSSGLGPRRARCTGTPRRRATATALHFGARSPPPWRCLCSSGPLSPTGQCSVEAPIAQGCFDHASSVATLFVPCP